MIFNRKINMYLTVVKIIDHDPRVQKTSSSFSEFFLEKGALIAKDAKYLANETNE